MARPFLSALRFGLALAIIVAAVPASGESTSEPRTHTVYQGQRLGSIAKRYGVTVDAICSANGIKAEDPIRPGQTLVIPQVQDRNGGKSGRHIPQLRMPEGNATSSPPRGPSEPHHHRVYPGQTLAKIAKRYDVSVEALCRANGISQDDPIKPGQLLIIPNGEVATREASRTSTGGASSSSAPVSATRPAQTRTHKVYPGHTLGKIAQRYNVSVDAICTANGIQKTDPIKPGQELVIPGEDDPKGSRTRETYVANRPRTPTSSRVARASAEPSKSGQSWKAYSRPPWRRGYVTLVGYNDTWKGYLIGPSHKVLPSARMAISLVMGASGDRPKADWRLLSILAQVSDAFGGRPIRVVSGYRTESYSLNSKHRKSQAIDFSIPGVPNAVLRDYLLTFSRVGVGYYPNSSFVHLDVRDQKIYWVDVSGPGEAPRYLR